MPSSAYHRHDLSDHAWKFLYAHLPGQKGQWGGIAQDNRRFLNAVFWILRTGAPWRDLPPDYGDWKNTHRRFCRWRDKGIWEKLLEQLIDEPDFEWLMIDASHIKVHPHAAGAVGGNQQMGRTKGGHGCRGTYAGREPCTRPHESIRSRRDVGSRHKRRPARCP
jgi:transposase